MSGPQFSQKLLYWYSANKRSLPWRGTIDPYKIWLSEVLLQQTRVQQGLPYYLKFIEHFPTVHDLAAADEGEVLKLWQGLGYYSRARNLRKAAIEVVADMGGIFPKTYDGLKALPGIGDYTASAIASICYNIAEPVVDGNVYRVLARYLGIDLPIDSSAGQKYFKTLAREVMDAEQPGEYNQAIMEFGAVMCTPKNPSCDHCVLATSCVALERNQVADLPVKAKRTKVKNRYFNYLVFKDPEGHTLMEQRKGKGIWQQLFQFPLIESKSTLSNENFKEVLHKYWPDLQPLAVEEPESEYRIHKLSHQHLITKFWVLPLADKLTGGITITEAEKLPMPVLLADTIKTLKNSYF